MIIDMHTHTFPDKIAGRALANMEKEIVDKHRYEVKIKVAGTLDALSESTKKKRNRFVSGCSGCYKT